MKSAQFSREQAQALRDLLTLWGSDSVVLVGASALGCFVDMNWRKTHDLDLSVSISMDEYPGELAGLVDWRPHPAHEHEWISPDDVRVDILPSAERHLEEGGVAWSESGWLSSLLGTSASQTISRFE